VAAPPPYIDRFIKIASIDEFERYCHSQAWRAYRAAISTGKVAPATPFHRPTPHRIERKILSSGWRFAKRALTQIMPRRFGECCLGLVIVGKGSDRKAIQAADQVARKFTKILKKFKIHATGRVEIPEPQKSGRYHLNIVIRFSEDDLEAIMSIIDQLDGLEVMEPGKYTHADYIADCQTFGSWHLPQPLWYSVKSLITEIDGIEHAQNLREAIVKNSSKHCSAVESRVWRRGLRIRLNRITQTPITPPTVETAPLLDTYAYLYSSDRINRHFQRLTLKTAANDQPSRIILPVRQVLRLHHPLQPLPRLLLTSLPRPSQPHKQARHPHQTGPPTTTGPPFHRPRSRSPPKPRPENGPGSRCFYTDLNYLDCITRSISSGVTHRMMGEQNMVAFSASSLVL
jgi:hypothetical protein